MSKAKIIVDPDGTVHLPPMAMPLSNFLSPEAKAGCIKYFRFLATPGSKVLSNTADVREEVVEHFAPLLERTRKLYPVQCGTETIAGVEVDVFTPRHGVAQENTSRILINLHGGGFVIGARIFGAIESLPMADIGRIKVIAPHYSQGPESRFPAATDDVVAVYRELLKSFEPSNIGIYGSSSGGVLTAQVIARVEKEDLPMPGAIGIFCASAGGLTSGDSAYLGAALIGYVMPRPEDMKHSALNDDAYFTDADLDDPLVMPIRSAELMSKFPPTLLLTSSRDNAASPAMHTHCELTRLGVEADLHIWDGMPHGFYVLEPEFPESKDTYNVAVKFFSRHLGRL